ncbi:MAG: DUF1330 domain-containing protein [Pseudonocardiaceae bacterium]
MSAYVISEVTERDAEQFARYRELASESIAAFGGEYLVRGTLPDAAEGEWDTAARLVIVRFPDRATLHDWYESTAYAPARALSNTALRRRLIFADGMAP